MTPKPMPPVIMRSETVPTTTGLVRNPSRLSEYNANPALQKADTAWKRAIKAAFMPRSPAAANPAKSRAAPQISMIIVATTMFDSALKRFDISSSLSM